MTTLIENTKFIEKIKIYFYSAFPDSYISISKPAISKDGLNVSIALGKDKSEFQNGIIQNDPIHTHFFIHENEGEYSLEAKISISSLKPDNSYMAMSSQKIRTRKLKFTNEQKNLAKAAKKLDEYFYKIKDALTENADKENFLPHVQAFVESKL